MKKSNTEFIQHSLSLCHKLADEKANGPARILVDALTETWFNSGRHNRHLNPFPLESCDTAKWGLTRLQEISGIEISGRGEADCCGPTQSGRALGDSGLGGPLSPRTTPPVKTLRNPYVTARNTQETVCYTQETLSQVNPLLLLYTCTLIR
jgi:hypothetical protein